MTDIGVQEFKTPTICQKCNAKFLVTGYINLSIDCPYCKSLEGEVMITCTRCGKSRELHPDGTQLVWNFKDTVVPCDPCGALPIAHGFTAIDFNTGLHFMAECAIQKVGQGKNYRVMTNIVQDPDGNIGSAIHFSRYKNHGRLVVPFVDLMKFASVEAIGIPYKMEDVVQRIDMEYYQANPKLDPEVPDLDLPEPMKNPPPFSPLGLPPMNLPDDFPEEPFEIPDYLDP